MKKKLLLILGVIFLLRIPSLFEPYWYGDEGIYLVLGQAMQRGAVLYRDIWDNKPPLLYLIYAIIPTLLWAKITAAACVLATTTIVYKISKNYLSALLVGVLLSIPLLEGTIANAELYFTLPIAIAAYIVIARNAMTKQSSLVIGFLLAIVFLLKIPAIFDFLGLFLAYLVIQLTEKVKFTEILKKYLLFLLPLLLSLFLLTIYFYFNHALGDFLIASFSQNASYVAIDSGPFSKLTNPLFIKAIILILGLLFTFILFIKNKISKELLILIFWFGFSLYGALLSNRPYLHYLLQIVPPGIILFFYLTHVILEAARRRADRIFPLIMFIFYLLIIFTTIKMFTGGFALGTKEYYVNFLDYVSERKTWNDYVNFFDSRTVTNYEIRNYIINNSTNDDSIFVWGDNAFIYVLSERKPATKFIQAHHLTTIDPKNYSQIIARLEKYQPKFIIISRPAHFKFPFLEALVKKNYRPVAIFNDLHVYQNTLPANPPKFNVNY